MTKKIMAMMGRKMTGTTRKNRFFLFLERDSEVNLQVFFQLQEAPVGLFFACLRVLGGSSWRGTGCFPAFPVVSLSLSLKGLERQATDCTDFLPELR